jgi:type IV pilus assembly protein PilQ
MRSITVKYTLPALLVSLAAICAICTAALAGDPNDASSEPPLEQRMQKKISVQFRKTPIDDVIRILAEQADVDIVKGPDVTGDITVTLTDVPLEEALNNILAVHGYSYVLSQNMIRIVTAAEKTDKPEPLQSKTFEIVYADVAEVVKSLKDFKSKQGSLSHIEGTSVVMVTDTESRIRDIATLLAKIDRPTPQILVEARIYDITSKERLDLGVEWQAGRNTSYSASAGITGEGTNPTAGRDDPFITSVFGGASAKAENAVGVLRLGWLNSGIDIDTLIRAQQENINAKLLANPRILVLDNELAKIRIISEIPYQELQESAAGGAIGTTSFREVGVELEVTPHLASRDQMIRLHLKPSFSVVTGTVQVVGQGASYPQPIVDRREADTTLLVKSGQTVVLGGLRKKTVTQQINKIPILGDIPGLGKLFRFTGEDTVNSELVVFITPRIVEQPVFSAPEADAHKETEFPGPQPSHTKAEKSAKEDKQPDK